MNNIQILGTMTKEPELKYTGTGTAILSFSIAYNEKYKKQDGSYEDKAMFFDVTAFGKRAETINSYFRKGSRILINGSLDYQRWSDKQSGQNRSKVGIKLNDFDFIDKRDSQTNTTQAQQQPTYEYQNAQGQQVTQQQYQARQQAQKPPSIDVYEDEIPF